MGHKHVCEDPELFGGREPLMSALKSGVGLQAVLFLLTACMLDGGQLFGQFLVAMIGYWIGVAFIVIRRETKTTRFDLFYVRYGSVILLVLAPAIAKLVYSIIGETPQSGLERLLHDRF